MKINEKLQFIADRMEDEKEFSVGSEDNWYRFRNFNLMCVVHVKTDYDSFFTSPLSLNYLLLSHLKLKPQWVFTEDEKVILRNLPDEFQWITRDESGWLYMFGIKPIKGEHQWWHKSKSRRDAKNLNILKHLFQSIKWTDDEPCEFRKYL